MATRETVLANELKSLDTKVQAQLSDGSVVFNGTGTPEFAAATAHALQGVVSAGDVPFVSSSALPVVSLFDGTVLYNKATNIYVVSPDISTNDLKTLLNTATDFSTVQFMEGTYTLTGLIGVSRGNITIQGMGENQTVFNAILSTNDTAAYKTSLGHSIFEFTGSVGSSTALTENVTAGETTIKVGDPSKFAVGQEIQISQINDAEFINTPLPADFANNRYVSDYVRGEFLKEGTQYGLIENSYNTTKYPLRVTLTEITAIDGDTITVKNPVAFDMTGGVAIVSQVKPLDNLVVGGFAITNDLPAPDPGAIVNAQPAWGLTDAIRFYYTRGTEVSNLMIVNSPSEGLTARSMYEANVHDVVIIGAHNKGSEGNGYGLNIAGTQFSNFDNLTIMDTRHAVLFSSWATEVGNTIHVLQTNRDINYHGSPDHSNVVTVDQDVLYYYGSDTNGFSIVSAGGTGHPYTNVDDNTTLFGYAVGGPKVEVIHGSNEGAYLSGLGGADYLYGGDGDDVILGGAGADYITPGKGADIIVMENESGTWQGVDNVYGFNPLEGDRIAFYNVNGTIKTSQVWIAARGNDTEVGASGINGSILLKGVTSDQMSKDYVILNDKSYLFDADSWVAQHKGDRQTLSQVIDTIPGLEVADASRAYTGSTVAGEVFAAGSGNDTVKGLIGNLTGDFLHMGAGRDTLTLTDRLLDFGPDNLPTMSGIDVIDIASSPRIGTVKITDAMVAQSDHGILLLINGNSTIRSLSAGLTSDDLHLTLQGSGALIRLANGVKNVIATSDDNLSEVLGGSAADKLYGGAGQDIFSGGKGADLFSMGVNRPGVVDIIRDFTPSQKDVLDISKMISGYDPAQHAIDHFVRLTSDPDNGKTVLQIDESGSGEQFHNAIVLESGISETVQQLIDHKNLIV